MRAKYCSCEYLGELFVAWTRAKKGNVEQHYFLLVRARYRLEDGEFAFGRVLRSHRDFMFKSNEILS